MHPIIIFPKVYNEYNLKRQTASALLLNCRTLLNDLERQNNPINVINNTPNTHNMLFLQFRFTCLVWYEWITLQNTEQKHLKVKPFLFFIYVPLKTISIRMVRNKKKNLGRISRETEEERRFRAFLSTQPTLISTCFCHWTMH